MMTEHQQADKVWEQTLPHLRMARKRRSRVKFALIAGPVCGLIALWLMFQQGPAITTPRVAVSPPPEPEPTLAVMRFDENGDTTLEELAPSELGSIELAFGLTPMVTDDSQEWWLDNH